MNIFKRLYTQFLSLTLVNSVSDKLQSIGRKKSILGLIGFTLVMLAIIPLTVQSTQQNQKIKQFASGTAPLTFVDKYGSPTSQTASATVSVQLYSPWPVTQVHLNSTTNYHDSSVAGASSYTIYDDALATGWTNGPPGSKINLQNTSPVYSGSYSISYSNQGNNKPLTLYTPSAGFLTTSYNAIQFYARASSPYKNATIMLTGKNNQPLSAPVPLSYFGYPSTTGWTLYTIPLSLLKGENQIIYNITFQNISNQNQQNKIQTLYFDQLQFIYIPPSSPSVTVPPTPTSMPTIQPTTPTIYTASVQVSDDSTFATNTILISNYSQNPYPLTFTFSNTTPGTKTLYVKFISSTGMTQTYSNTIQLIAQTSTPTPSSQQTPTPITSGWVHVNGTALYDGNGNHIHFSGVDGGGEMTIGEGSTPGKCGKTWSPPSVAEINAMKQIGFNLDRITLTWANIEPTPPTVNPDGSLTHHWNQAYLTALDTYINELQQDNMMAILDLHQAGWSPYFTFKSNFTCSGVGVPSWLYAGSSIPQSIVGVNQARHDFFADQPDVSNIQVPENPEEGFYAVWSMLAQRYTSNPTVVGADMFNEPWYPSSCTQCSLASFYETTAATIRTVNPHIILIYEPQNILTTKLNLTNVIDSRHYYPSDWTTGQSEFAADLAQSQSWGVPLWIGETDAMTGDKNPQPSDPNWQADLQSEMTYFIQNDISWSLWNYHSGPFSVVIPNTTTPKIQLTHDLQCDGDMQGVSASSNCSTTPSPLPTPTQGP